MLVEGWPKVSGNYQAFVKPIMGLWQKENSKKYLSNRIDLNES